MKTKHVSYQNKLSMYLPNLKIFTLINIITAKNNKKTVKATKCFRAGINEIVIRKYQISYSHVYF